MLNTETKFVVITVQMTEMKIEVTGYICYGFVTYMELSLVGKLQCISLCYYKTHYGFFTDAQKRTQTYFWSIHFSAYTLNWHKGK